MAKFLGNFEQLCGLVAHTGVVGRWRQLLNGHVQFRGSHGAILNWWRTTGTINVQGKPEAAEELKLSLAGLAAEAGAPWNTGTAVVRLNAASPPPKLLPPEGGLMLPSKRKPKFNDNEV